MKFTGERLIPGKKVDELHLNHLSRYMVAAWFTRGKRVLDIACGTGYGSYHLRSSGARRVTGIDISKDAISFASSNYVMNGLTFKQGAVESIPEKENTFDAVVSLETLEHVDKKAQVRFVKEVKRVLRSGGVFIVSTPNRQIFRNKNKFHKNELYLDDFKAFLSGYFKNTCYFYQDNLEASLIIPENDLSAMRVEGSETELLEKLDPRRAKYFVGVCSDGEIDPQKTLVTFSDIQIRALKETFAKQIKGKNLELAAHKKWISHLEKDIEILKLELAKNSLKRALITLGRKIIGVQSVKRQRK